MTTIPEVLRLAPGVEVAQINGNTWAITIRGMNYRFADKLLVMIDGRTIYSSIFSGVFWDLQDMPLEDIERIEVVRGPGGTLWGANAMNGVINIITKHARDTQGLLFSSSGGTQGYRQGLVRYGGTVGETLAYRVYGKYRRWDRTPGLVTPGPDAYDAWDDGRGGFRVEWTPSPTDALTLTGDIFRGAEEYAYPAPLLEPPWLAPFDFKSVRSGGNVLLRWERKWGERSDLTVQAYYDRFKQDQVQGSMFQEVFDLEAQYRRQLGSRQELVLGAGLRAYRNKNQTDYFFGFDPTHRTLFWASGFVQDEITLLRDRLWVILGSKFEANEYTGLEMQPSVRLRWQPHARHVLWAAVSRAVTAPNDLQEIGHRADQAFPGPGGMPVLTMLTGSRNLEEQELLAYEFGYRTQPHRKVSLDLAAFYNIYNHFSGVNPGKPFLDLLPPPPHLVMPLYFGNPIDRHTYGFEAAGVFTATPYWKLSGSYSWLMETRYPELLLSPTIPFRPGDDPRQQIKLRSELSLPHNLELDMGLFYLSPLPAQGVPNYLRWDARLGWRPNSHLEFSLVGQNLLDPYHPEFVRNDWAVSAQVPRSAYVRVTWRF